MDKDVFRKGMVLGIIFLFVGAGVVPSVVGETTSYETTIYVDDDNTEGPWDGTQAHPYQHIQDAISASTNGDTIFVYNGIFNEKITVSKTINLIGENRASTIIINDGGGGEVIEILSDGVKLIGFTIQNTGTTWYHRFFRISSNNNTIQGNDIIGSINKHGIVFSPWSPSNNNTIIDNRFFNCGIYPLYSSGNVVINNTVNGKPLIFLDGESNKIINDAGQIILKNCDGISVENVTITNTTHGVFLWNSHYCYVANSGISNTQIGVSLESSSDNLITRNIISTTGDDAIYLYKSHQNGIEGNSFETNRIGIRLFESTKNRIIQNNFINIVQEEAFFMGYSILNSWFDNYWGRLRILPKIIFGCGTIGGIPIPWVNVDWHPAKEPYDIP